MFGEGSCRKNRVNRRPEGVWRIQENANPLACRGQNALAEVARDKVQKRSGLDCEGFMRLAKELGLFLGVMGATEDH